MVILKIIINIFCHVRKLLPDKLKRRFFWLRKFSPTNMTKINQKGKDNAGKL